MNMPFPFDLPGPTAFYISLLVLTFALHQAFMHYVLAGSLYVAWAALFPGSVSDSAASDSTEKTNGVARKEQSLTWILRDWMPFLLSAAITAGVAPLLFIQIVYQRQFYTANLLLFWRWMAVVPVLIVAFYLLYLIKSQAMVKWTKFLRATVALVTASCFVFVGFCWSANHLLGMSESKWVEIYVTGRLPIVATDILSRMLLWISGSFATMTAIVGWQLRYHQLRQKDTVGTHQAGHLAILALIGLGMLSLAGVLCIAQSTAETRQLVFSSTAVPYLILSVVGIVAQTVGWACQYRFDQFRSSLLGAVSAGAVLSLLSVSFLREAIRANTIDLSSQYAKHVAASKVGGFAVFVGFTIIVGVTIAWCFWIVRQGLRQDSKPGN